MYYHASQQSNIKILEPRISNHGIPLVYFSTKRENVLVYLSNAVEKYGQETGFEYNGNWKKWGPYGFEADGTFRYEEYYPNALIDTYKGVSGYIYYTERIANPQKKIEISNVFTTSERVQIEGYEFVPDAYEAIMEAAEQGLIKILKYEDMSEQKRNWIKRTIQEEYQNVEEHPEYGHFLRGKFELD